MTMQSPSLAPAEPRAHRASSGQPRLLAGLLGVLLLALTAGLAPALAQDPAAAQTPAQ